MRKILSSIVTLCALLASPLLVFSDSDDISNIRMEFCQNGSTSNSVVFSQGTTIPASVCVRFTNLSSTPINVVSEVVDGYLMADSRVACRENSDAKTGLGKTAAFGVSGQEIPKISVNIPGNGSVDGQLNLHVSDTPTSSLFGCVIAYSAQSASANGISIVTRKAIVMTVEGRNGSLPLANTASGSSSTSAPVVTTPPTPSTSSGSSVSQSGSSAGSGASSPSSSIVADVPVMAIKPSASGSVIMNATGSIEVSREATGALANAVDPLVRAIIQSDPRVAAQLETNPAFAGAFGASSSGGGGSSSVSASASSSVAASDPKANPCGNYSDISGNSEFCPYVRILVLRDVIKKRDSFEPDRPITRAEFLKIVLRSSQQTLVYDPAYSYSDVSDEDWWAAYVSTAKKAGYISATNATFRPNDSITRAEAIKMLVGITGRSPEYDPAYSYSDVSDEDWWAAYVSTAKKAGYISATNSRFRPGDLITRAESGKIVVTGMADKLLLASE